MKVEPFLVYSAYKYHWLLYNNLNDYIIYKKNFFVTYYKISTWFLNYTADNKINKMSIIFKHSVLLYYLSLKL